MIIRLCNSVIHLFKVLGIVCCIAYILRHKSEHTHTHTYIAYCNIIDYFQTTIKYNYLLHALLNISAPFRKFAEREKQLWNSNL